MPEAVRPLLKSFLEASPVGMDREALVETLHDNFKGFPKTKIRVFLDELVEEGFLVREGNKLDLAEELEPTVLRKKFRLGRYKLSIWLRKDLH